MLPMSNRNRFPVTFTLLDENREPYSRSDVELVVGVESKVLAPSCTFNVTLLRRKSKFQQRDWPSFLFTGNREVSLRDIQTGSTFL